MKSYALVTKSEAFLYDHPGEKDSKAIEEPSDVLLSGWAVGIRETKEGWAKVITHYGYEGWLWEGDFRPSSEEELKEKRMRLSARSADVLSLPKVQGILLTTLWQDSFFTVLEESPDGAWVKIRTASQVEGYIPSSSIKERLDTDAFLLQEKQELSWFSSWATKLRNKKEETEKEKTGIEVIEKEEIKKEETKKQEQDLRDNIIKSARSYLGCAYRWGGKTPAGIDCSGLAFMSYLENGLLIYRDARFVEGYPIHPISREELKKGDLIFFPGHEIGRAHV